MRWATISHAPLSGTVLSVLRRVLYARLIHHLYSRRGSVIPFHFALYAIANVISPSCFPILLDRFQIRLPVGNKQGCDEEWTRLPSLFRQAYFVSGHASGYPSNSRFLVKSPVSGAYLVSHSSPEPYSSAW